MNNLRSQLSAIRDALFPRRMCAKKKRYVTASFAVSALNRRIQYEQGLQIYKCPECHGWHLTKMEQPK
jgi:hypothetical protein